jgi:hypothetical protein
VVVNGALPATLDPAMGGVQNMPLQAALVRLVPQGWTLYARDAQGSLPVTFSWVGAGKPWLKVLDTSLEASGLVGTVDFARREVSIARR